MNSKSLNIIGKLLLIFLLLFFLLKSYIETNKLEQEHRITIGNVYDYYIPGRGGYDLYYNYYVNSKKYESIRTIYENPKKFANKRFFVMFYPPNPKNSKLLLLHGTVPEQIQQAPPEGWEGIPKVVKKKVDE